MGSFQHPSSFRRPPPFQRLAIERIENLSDAVRDANLRATQLSASPLSGSLVSAERDGIICSSGHVNGRVALSGPLSCDIITLGVGLRFDGGNWQWSREVETGSVGVFHPADEHNSIHNHGSLYAVVSLSEDALEAEAARFGLVLDRRMLGASGLHSRLMDADKVRRLAATFDAIHAQRSDGANAPSMLLSALIEHLARLPLDLRRPDPNRHARIVQKAQVHIEEHLAEPLSLAAIADAAHTSYRTLIRAFSDVLGETPYAYVQRLRLHRIRHNLASDSEAICTISLIAHQWGMSDPGRMAGWYRDLFGESPSATVASRDG